MGNISRNLTDPFFPPMNRRGMVLGIVAIVAAFVFLLVFNLTMFSQGEMTQLVRSEHLITCELAARSAYQRQINELRVKPWAKRSFALAPMRLQETQGDHELDILIENTPDQRRSADLWIVASRGKVKRLVFWRLHVTESVFQKINDVQPVYFAFLDPDRFGPDGDRPEVRRMVDQALAQRERKQREKEILTRKVLGKRQFGGVMSELGIPVMAEVMDVQTPFVPGSSVGYVDSPLNMLLAGFKTDSLIAQGAMSMSDFTVVKTESNVDPSMLAKLKERVGEDKSLALLQQMSRMERENESDPLLLIAARKQTASSQAELLTLISPPGGSIFGDGEGPDIGDDGTGDAAGDAGDESDVSSVAPIGTGGLDWLVADPDAVDAAANPVTEPPVAGDPSPEPAPPVIPPGGSEFSFDDLITRRDLYDDHFEEIWNGTPFKFMRRAAAFGYQTMKRWEFKSKLDKGTATMADFESYVRANNSYAHYTKDRHVFSYSEGKRDKVIDKARAFFNVRPSGGTTAGVPVDSEGNPVN